ncbi:MAG TPA: DinB family protein [Thermoanaerobaculia bacterium]|nr:DinB family protein [Thermoanaerobaculia bacterium]
MHLNILRGLLICLLAPAAIGLAQDRPPTAPVAPSKDPYTAYNKMVYQGVKAIVLRSAEKMPEENYSFKPTEVVRSFGQIVGHLADAQYTFCSKVLGEKRPEIKVEETKTSKADLMASLKDAFAYCDRAYTNMTDASGADTIKFMGRDTPKLGALTTNSLHTVEHYGNLVSYMRMKGIVPPSSDPEFDPLKK